MQMRNLAVFAVAFSVALAAGAQGATAAANPLAPMGVSITAPPEYNLNTMTAFGSHRGTVAAFMPPSAALQNGHRPINVFAEDRDGRTAEKVALDFGNVMDGETVTVSQAHKICSGTQEGWLLQVDMPQLDEVETVVAAATGTRAIAARSLRKRGMAPDSAVSALDTLCFENVAPEPPRSAVPVENPQLDALLTPLGVALQLPADYALMDGADARDKTQGPLLFFMQRRLKADGVLNSIALQVDPRNGRSLQQYLHAPGMFDPSKFPESHAATVCHGTQPAWLLAGDDATSKMHVRAVFAVGELHAAVILYSRNSSSSDDPAAIASMPTLCVK